MFRSLVLIACVSFTNCYLLRAHAAVSTSTRTHFEAMCVKSDALCQYVGLTFLNSGRVIAHEVVLLHIGNEAAVAFWNHHILEKHAWNDASDVDVAIYDGRTAKWMPIAADAHCPLCIPETRLLAPGKQLVRFEYRRTSSWRPKDSWWYFKRIVARDEHQRLLVVINSPDEPVVYASLRTSGTHVEYSTKKTGQFRMLLESRWVQTALPDYVVISTMPSWAAVARQYMLAQVGALTGSDKLPEFHGSTEQVVEAAVHYLVSLGIGYDDKLDAGGYPNQTITGILGQRRTDCKGFATLLVALLRRSNVVANPVAINASGKAPLSLGVPDDWADHVMVYVPAIDRYVDATAIFGGHGKYTWQTSAAPYGGSVVLNLASGKFTTIPSESSVVGNDGETGAALWRPLIMASPLSPATVVPRTRR